MTLRVHFTGEDLARIRMADSADPLWEALLSMHMLQNRRAGRSVFGEWRQRAAAALAPRIRALISLAPPRGYSPDFLTPAGGNGLEAGVDAVASTPRRRLAAEMARLAEGAPLSPWARGIAEGRAAELRGLTTALRDYHRQALEPYWQRIQAQVAADRAMSTGALLSGGLGEFFEGLHPSLRWNYPLLEVHGFPTERDLHLNGRGLRLVPSFFCWRVPITLHDPDLEPVLVYPVTRDPAWLTATPAEHAQHPDHPLSALLGRTRAAALKAVADGCTTGELARRLAISPATASHHIGVLRDSGLVATRRTGGSVHHTLQPLGTDLLRGLPFPAEPLGRSA